MGLALPLLHIHSQLIHTPSQQGQLYCAALGMYKAYFFRMVQLVWVQANAAHPYPQCFGGDRSCGINTDKCCSRAMALDMAPGSSPGLDDTIALGGIAGHLDWHEPNGSMGLKVQHGPRCGSKSWAFTLHSMVTGASDISAGSICDRTMDADKTLAAAHAI